MPHPHLVITIFVALLAWGTSQRAEACTSYLITKGASSDNSTIITYSSDSVDLYGELYYTPAGRYAAGTRRDIYDWDTGKYIGQIQQSAATLTVVGNINERQVVIGETTFGGRPELINPTGLLDYGSLMYVTLQRASSARDAIRIMAELTTEYGYRSSGESYSISDPDEAWLMEVVGKGPEQKGMLWVARRIPDGYVSGHANQARIQQFPLHEPAVCLYANDVISFARKKGLFHGADVDFSFADVYAPRTGLTLRTAETRIWSLFRRIAPSANLPKEFSTDATSPALLPLWVKPARRLSVSDVMALMRDHFEGTSLDLSQGVGAGPHGLPYRWRPLTWKFDGADYTNERPVSTQQTGFSFVAQSRGYLPNPIGGLLWFGVDDTYSTVYVPIYCGIREAPRAFAVGTGNFREFNWESAFWVFNFVSNYTYLRYNDMIRDVQRAQQDLEGGFVARQTEVEATALRLYRDTPDLAHDFLTNYSAKQTQITVDRWRKLGESLIVKYLDGNVRDEDGRIREVGYPEAWYRRVAGECGNRCKIPRLKSEQVKSGADAVVAPTPSHP